jgi:hypothetical protein
MTITIPTQLIIWIWPSQNTFGMWTVLYWTRSSRTQFGVSINVWRLAGDTLNLTCNFLYFYHQVHRDFLFTLYLITSLFLNLIILSDFKRHVPKIHDFLKVVQWLYSLNMKLLWVIYTRMNCAVGKPVWKVTCHCETTTDLTSMGREANISLAVSYVTLCLLACIVLKYGPYLEKCLLHQFVFKQTHIDCRITVFLGTHKYVLECINL